MDLLTNELLLIAKLFSINKRQEKMGQAAEVADGL